MFYQDKVAGFGGIEVDGLVVCVGTDGTGDDVWHVGEEGSEFVVPGKAAVLKGLVDDVDVLLDDVGVYKTGALGLVETKTAYIVGDGGRMSLSKAVGKRGPGRQLDGLRVVAHELLSGRTGIDVFLNKEGEALAKQAFVKDA